MNLNRVFRDGGILLILCLAFYAMAAAVSQLRDDEENRLFSKTRIRADRAFKAKQWPEAIEYYRALTEEDPYNGLAWNSMAYAYLACRLELDDAIEEALEDPDAEEHLAELYRQAREYEDQTIEAYEKSTQFLRYRRRSLLNLTLAYILRSDWELAMDCLESYLNEGYFTNQGIASFRQYGRGGPQMVDAEIEDPQRVRLHQFPRFWELVERENKLRTGTARQRGFAF